MRMWGVTPLLAVVLLGGGVGMHQAAASHTIHNGRTYARLIATSGRRRPTGTGASQSPVPSVTPSIGPPPGTPLAATLTMIGPRLWETMVLLNETSPACTESAKYSLETTVPDGVFSRFRIKRVIDLSPRSASGSSCQVTVIFNGPAQFPATAALIVGQGEGSSAISLTVSRNLTLLYYLGIPAAAGAGMVILFGLSLFFVKIYDWDGTKLRPGKSKFWQRSVSASGAWSASDSWATNITTVIAVVTTTLAAITAPSFLFPGVALDRFAIVNLVAGGIVVAAPVVFGICYAKWAGRHPGVTAEAMLALPIAATLAAEAHVRLLKGSPVVPPMRSGVAAAHR